MSTLDDVVTEEAIEQFLVTDLNLSQITLNEEALLCDDEPDETNKVNALVLLNQTLKDNTQLRKDLNKLQEDFTVFKNESHRENNNISHVSLELHACFSKFENSYHASQHLFESKMKSENEEILVNLAVMREELNDIHTELSLLKCVPLPKLHLPIFLLTPPSPSMQALLNPQYQSSLKRNRTDRKSTR